ncbi:MAG: hypothetical protein EA388_01890 [Nitriliruptor sp.]|nr:MAG: hypothetical protein EA388_01890 [Nitriliruptor sp.]
MRATLRSDPGRSRSSEPAAGSSAATELVRLRVAAGLDPGDDADLPPRTRRAVAIARTVGAPLLEALDAGLAAEEDVREAARAVAVASAQTRVVAGGLLLAPLLLVPGLGRLVGADLVGFYTSPMGGVVLLVGSALLGLGAAIVWGLVRRVSRPPSAGPPGAALAAAVVGCLIAWRLGGLVAAVPVAVILWHMVARTRGPEPLPGLDEAADLIATARGGGTTSAEALRLTAVQLPHLARPLRRLAFDLDVGAAGGSGSPSGQTDLDRLATVLVAAHDVGAPVAPSLRRLAADLRADELARVLAAAERLPAQLTFPTALCLLPATVLLVGAPIVQAGLMAAGA